MASSSDNEHHRSQQRPAPLARQNSSFFGSVKNILSAPLKFLSRHEQDEEATPGKRRRPLELEPTEELDEEDDSQLGRLQPRSTMAIDPDSDDEGTRRSKRMRMHSPPRQHYLDPPSASLRRTEPPRRSSVVPRASSARLPSSAGGRSTMSPRRQFAPARTMSIDPPGRSVSGGKESGFDFGPPPSSAESDYDMAVDSKGDWSVPPSPRRSPRPSFRMRSSVTPQPQFSRPPMRYISEPPQLNNLAGNPSFVSRPNQALEQVEESSTLGSLAESVKATISPTKQHHEPTIFSASQRASTAEGPRGSERTLHGLQVYKTPLLPSRMRTSDTADSLTGSKVPDFFASLRRKRLELIGEKGGEGSSAANETKPYAGKGALRRLLARRKQEITEEEQAKAETQPQVAETSRTTDPISASPAADTAPPDTTTLPPPPPPIPPIPEGDDWFAPLSEPASSQGSSSLRVGRTISSRKHINRPSPLQRPAQTKFSAAYEEDGDDTMNQTKTDVPQLFAAPVGFSFAKETAGPDLSAELEKAKEPPLTSLPFSFGNPAPSVKPAPAKVSPPTSTPSDSSSTKPVNLFAMPKATPPESKTSGIPNFFANSSFVKQTPLPAAPVLSFPSVSAPKSSTGPPASVPVPDFFAPKPKPAEVTPKVDDTKENPFWVGGSDKPSTEGGVSAFGGFGKTSALKPAAPEAPASSTSSPFGFPAPSQSFSFGKPAQADSAPSSATTDGAKPSADASKPFSFGAPAAETKAPALSTAAPVSSSVADQAPAGGMAPTEKKPEVTNLFGNVKPATPVGNLFGTSTSTTPAAPAPTFTFGATPEASRASTPTFPSATTAPSSTQPNFFASPAVQTPPADPAKSMFAAPSSTSTAFSFGASTATPPKAPESKAFSFGAPAPAAETSKPAAFSFGQAAPSLATPSASASSNPTPAFSFGTGTPTAGSASADVSNKQFFSFGQPAAPAAPGERPVTPPKNDSNEFMMEESPTRDIPQVSKAPETRPTLGLGGGFSFGIPSASTTASSPFETKNPPLSSTPFSFGASAPSNPFAQKKPEETSAFGGGFGQPASPAAPPPIQTSFSFGQTTKSPDPQRPNTAGGFGGFGSAPSSATAPSATPFTFGAPSTTASNPFGQPAASNSAPSSPSFNSTNPFAFGAPAAAPAPAGAFTFGSSQPASPASGGPLALPPSGFGASSGGFGQPPQQPSSPFGAPALLTPTTSGGGGGNLFTIGAAPPQTTQAGRTIKKLPNRRGGAKR